MENRRADPIEGPFRGRRGRDAAKGRIGALPGGPSRFFRRAQGVRFLAGILIAAACASFAAADPLPRGYARAAARAQEAKAARERMRRARSALAAQNARAHAHSRSSGVSGAAASGEAFCPAWGPARAAARRTSFANPYAARFAPTRTQRGSAAANDAANDAQTLFRERLSARVVQAKCVNCHVSEGISGHTRLVFLPAAAAGREAHNLEAFRAFVASVGEGADRILDKIRGIAHGGGVQVPAGSADFADMERFLRILEREAGGSSSLSPDTLFDGVTMASPAKTLRRAALIFAGRLPTDGETASAADGRPASLRRAVRTLMSGKGFHDFLIRASNDRLLTDRRLDSVLDFPLERNLTALAERNWEMARQAVARGADRAEDDPLYADWEAATQYGLARTPLELIARVVENDLPYTEILTADYIMANPQAAAAYGASTRFNDPGSATEFQPSRIAEYYRNDNSKLVDFDRDYGTRIINRGNLATDYPHAGILNTNVFLRRYPTTPTNRNRARARWTLLHFLGFDIEGAALRAPQAVSPADADNPTLKNPACTGCHNIMDPIAGTFQNYAEEGAYKNNFGGIDSLAESYKYPLDGKPTAYRYGDTWYRDMLPPGFDGREAPDSDNGLQWLAAQIAADPRFAEGAVEFWRPAIMGAETAAPPADRTHPDFAGLLLARQARAAEIERLAAGFREGFGGGAPYNAKDLFIEMVMSPWFRAESTADADSLRRAALRQAGGERLLTPEELARKTDAITGYRWGRRSGGFVGEVGHLDGEGEPRGGAYETLYGGIDSNGVFERARVMTPLMAAVAQAHAVQVSCAVVMREFYLWPESRRRLFAGIGARDTPVSQAPRGGSGEARIRRKLAELHWKLFGVRAAVDSPDVEAAYRLFAAVWRRKRSTEGPRFRDGDIECPIDDVAYFDGILDDVVTHDEQGNSRIDWERVEASWDFDMDDSSYAVRTWVVTLAGLMTDYRYLHL